MKPIPKFVRFLAVTSLLMAAPAAYGGLGSPADATKGDLAASFGGTCWALTQNSSNCAASKSTCNSDGDGTYTWWLYTGILYNQRVAVGTGNNLTSANRNCAVPWDCHFDSSCNSGFVPGGNCNSSGTPATVTDYAFDTECKGG
jgi:hypothetical protein